MNKNFVLCLLGGILSFAHAAADEFLIHDAQYQIRLDQEPWWGVYTWPFDGVGPENWLSPQNYYTGTFYMRYEIISQPTHRASEMSIAIWQDYIDWTRPWSEQASPRTVLNGPGSVSFASSSPSSWWIHTNDNGTTPPLDFSRPDAITMLGVVVGSSNPYDLIRPNDPQHPNWIDRADWFPMTIRITMVAVSSGAAFSGDWDRYLGSIPGGIQPNYTINYNDERTGENVLSQHEYSTDQQNWTQGQGVPVTVIPGSTLYFRDKDHTSLTQSLEIIDRPAEPGFGIDFSSKQTQSAVGAGYEYSSLSSMSPAFDGTGTPVAVSPGTDLYFRKKATSSSFRSAVQHLVVPALPSVPVFTIDFIHERTSELIDPPFEYSFDLGMNPSVTGVGEHLNLEPGSTWYFRRLATASSFGSGIQTLPVPNRPEALAFSINYEDETTLENVSATYEYDATLSFDTPEYGEDAPLTLEPGSSVCIRKSATTTSFAGAPFTLQVPNRPEALAFSINYEDETTLENVSDTCEYDVTLSFDTPEWGGDAPLALEPGTTVYFRKRATAASFAGEPYTLQVPNRPLIVFSSPSPTHDTMFYAQVYFGAKRLPYDTSKVEIQNAAYRFADSAAVELRPLAEGQVQLELKANAVEAGNFSSGVQSIEYRQNSGVELLSETFEKNWIYPNPAQDWVAIASYEAGDVDNLVVFVNASGREIYRQTLNSNRTVLDVSAFLPGVYGVLLINGKEVLRQDRLILLP